MLPVKWHWHWLCRYADGRIREYEAWSCPDVDSVHDGRANRPHPTPPPPPPSPADTT